MTALLDRPPLLFGWIPFTVQRAHPDRHRYSPGLSQETGGRTMDNIDGKVAFITGGASGIGLGLAKVLVKAGAKGGHG